MKGIELTLSQIKAYENGGTKFLFPIRLKELEFNCYRYWWKDEPDIDGAEYYQCWEDEIIPRFSPIQKGDKDIFVQEEFVDEYPHGICIRKDYDEEDWQDLDENGYINKASKMTKEQSRYSFSECIDVKVIRVQDIDGVTGFHFPEFYNRCMQERNINRTYKDNDYVFSVEFKK